VDRLTRISLSAAGLFAAAFIFACSDPLAVPDQLAVADQPQFGVTRVRPAFTRCRPQPRAVTSAWIGPKGGTLKAGGHVFTVPEGAVSERTLITMEAPSDTINRVVFSPEGLTFAPGHSPHLVISYKNCTMAKRTRQEIAYVNSYLQVVEVTASVSDTLGLTVDGRLNHFSDYVLVSTSTYAVAY
jgi:hypothetical protein